MSVASIRVLLVEDNATDVLIAQDELAHAVGANFVVEVCQRLEPALAMLAHTSFDVVLLDLSLPDSDGLSSFYRLCAVAPTLPVVVLSHRRDEQLALEAVQAGAQDYLVKGQAEGLLVRAIRYAIERRRGEATLAENEERLRLALRAGKVGIYDLNLETHEATVNPEYVAMLGYDPVTFHETTATWSARLHPDDRDVTTAMLSRFLAGEVDDYRVEFRQRSATDRWVWVLSTGRIIAWDAGGKPLRMLGTHTDISERKQAQMREQLYASVFAQARESILITDADGQIVEVNDTFTRVTGYSRDEVLGQNPRFLRSGRQPADFYAALWHDLTTLGYWSGEIWNRRKTGELYVELKSISAVCDAKGAIRHYVSLGSDITHIKDHQRQLEHIAHYDLLTGLPNRVLLVDRLQQAMAHCQRRGQCLAVAFLDLDGFKAVNDQHGHEMGDTLLNALAHRMKEALRDGDSLSRFGGDEFVAVLVDLEQAKDCEPVLDRLLHAASESVELGGSVLQVSASIGVTIYPQDGVDADLLIRHADQAMYQAKLAGKNRYHLFDVASDVATQSQREGLNQIRQGLLRQEFVLYYQPKVNMRTGEVIGAEALIRWQHPERGVLPPGLFLPMIENHPISVEVGEWVIATALAQMSTWLLGGLQLPVSVNIGARQLQQPDFVDRLARLLASCPNVAPESLELEILETSALEDIAQVSDVMRACHALGVSFALDDFGTGYSSLTYLKRLPAELLKIDQSFVRDMLTDSDDLAIVQGVIGLAKAFRRKVIAEGVETIAHGQLLLPLGCELAQGYGIARPMPAADIPAWVAAWTPDAAWSGVGA